jgi:uncharacterized protein YjlB
MGLPQVLAHLLPANGAVPNHPRWPLLVYPAALALDECDPAAAFEEVFGRNQWPAAWRNGVHGFHHFHSTAHEALGIYSGEVTVCFGGDGGIAVTGRPGDVIVLPAGTGHKRLASRGSLGVVGAYPAGQHADTCTPMITNARRAAAAVARVPLPACDPVFGTRGPLLEHWRG